MCERMRNVVAAPTRHAGNQHWHADATFGCVELVTGQWRDRGTGPTGARNAVGALAAKSINILGILRPQPGLRILVVAALGTVVRQEHKHRVLVFAGGFEVGNKAANFMVHGIGHGGINLHLALLVELVFFAERVPVAGGTHPHHRRVRGNDAQCCRAFATLFAQGVPAVLVFAAVLFDKCTGCLNWHMVGLKAQVGKKWFAFA